MKKLFETVRNNCNFSTERIDFVHSVGESVL